MSAKLMPDAAPQFIEPTSFLGDKVPRSGGLPSKDAISKALNLADSLIGSYQGWAVDDLQRLWDAFGGRTRSAAATREMFSIAHEIRGQGGSFDFPLISLIADSLCKFLEPRSRIDERDLDIVKIHILAMKSVFAQKLRGKHPALSTELANLLPRLRDRS